MSRSRRSSRSSPLGERVSDSVTGALGSWAFLICQSAVLAAWVGANALRGAWDPYPFILLNLMLSFQAAYSAPVIMMAAKRVEARDRERAVRFEEATSEILARLEGLTEMAADRLTGIERLAIIDALGGYDKADDDEEGDPS